MFTRRFPGFMYVLMAGMVCLLSVTSASATAGTWRHEQGTLTLDEPPQRLEQAGLTDRPVALVNFLDDRHVRIYAPNGLYQNALNALGLENAWPHQGNYWGFSVVGLEAIAPYRDSRIVVIEPTLPGLADTLAGSPFWTYLPPVKRQQVYRIETVWPFGGVFPVKRLAILLTDSLLAGGSDNVR